MRQLRRFGAALVAVALCLSLTPALAAEDIAAKFPGTKTYAGFADVAADNWALPYVKVCYETGLMNGTGGGFNPTGSVLVSEAAAIAARIGSVLTGKEIPKVEGAAWFVGACQYVHELATLAGNTAVTDMLVSPTAEISREGFFAMLALAMPATALAAKNSITALPDTTDADVLNFYNAGVLTGINDYGTFAGRRGLSRGEMAAMAARVVRPALALAFTPVVPDFKDKSFDLSMYFTGFSDDTICHSAGGYDVSLELFLSTYLYVATDLAAECEAQGIAFSWDNTTGDVPFTTYALQQGTGHALFSLWRADHKDDALDTSALLGAKHILIGNKTRTDAEALAEAQRIRAELKAAGDTAVKFDTLMAQYSEDGGSKSQPNGYTFGDGEMVAEFERATKGLTVGQISDPVKSEFGYHIILRIPPDPEAKRDKLEMAAFNAWYTEQSLTTANIVEKIDLPAVYEAFVALTEKTK